MKLATISARSLAASKARSVTGNGHKLFELMCAHDLEGVVAKRLKDGYGSRARWLKDRSGGSLMMVPPANACR